MSKNKKLNNAIKNKNDEFYTQLKDIEKELENYKNYFKNKTIYCNCDNPKFSNFFKYFFDNFENLQLKELIVSYKEKEQGFYLIYNKSNKKLKLKKLKENGDFRSDECINLLKKSDIVVTNPPFSLFKDFISLLLKEKKFFIIIGNSNALSFKKILENIMTNKIRLGINCVRWFFLPNGNLCEGARSFWYTNLDLKQNYQRLDVSKSYSTTEYFEYDNYKAIEVSRTKDIPYNFEGIMGVPITFLSKYNPEQFKIIGADYQVKDGELAYIANKKWKGKLDRAYLNGKRLYSRIFIKNILKEGVNNAI
ncbi:adenosine deaminase [Leptotrichia wadei]|jgi:uncharacterized adenine-specific methylase MG184|uniref:adenine-specific methyltransferase EcoRI family protein n=1 Tax=Leptotrichia wadei TaxID=157687 RepID=UPI0028EAA23A|nr:adenine-specific methyltransferase EcoRI family protein [uncultured Leptotrichia sp.]